MTERIYSELVAYIDAGAEKIEKTGRASFDKDVANILGGIEGSAYFEKAVYLAGVHVYGSAGEDRSEEALSIAETIGDVGGDIKKSYYMNSTTSPGHYDILIVKPVSDAYSRQGVIVGVYDCTPTFSLSIYEEIASDAQLYFVGPEGMILAEAKHPDFSNMKLTSNNFFNRMMTMVEGNNSSKAEVQNLRVTLFRKNNQELELKSPLLGSDHIIVNTTILTDADQLAYVSMYNLDTLVDASNKTVRKTWIVLGIILLATLAANIFIWNYLRNVTNRIERMAFVDDVTKGRNFNYFRTESVKILHNYSEMPYLIQRFDISNFRYLNEAYGHIRADEILKACIDIYEEIYTDREMCVRISSDQFVTLTINDPLVDEKRDKYEQSLNTFARSKGIRYPIKLKFGIYQIRKTDTDIDVMIDRANVARKTLSRSKTEFLAVYSDNIVQNMRKTEAIEADKEKALKTGEFKVFIQAKWDIINDCVAGGEALVRWIKADGNMVFPDEFIPVFEENGFIEQIDFYMLETVCERMAQVKKMGGTIYPISVNQSRVLLNNPDYVDRVRGVFERYDIPREFVELEVTETSLADNKEHMIEVLTELKKENIRLDMDDFGSGYSSLNLLKDMPFDVMKIDREFFSESITSTSSTLILQKIVEMANGLGIEVICEGVENQQQVDLLKEIGCRRVQGYYYAKPVPMEVYIQNYCNLPKTDEAE